jgi:hypothetical protein
MGLRLVDAATEDLGLGINMAGITRLRITRALYFDRPGHDELRPAMPATHFPQKGSSPNVPVLLSSQLTSALWLLRMSRRLSRR